MCTRPSQHPIDTAPATRYYHGQHHPPDLGSRLIHTPSTSCFAFPPPTTLSQWRHDKAAKRYADACSGPISVGHPAGLQKLDMPQSTLPAFYSSSSSSPSSPSSSSFFSLPVLLRPPLLPRHIPAEARGAHTCLSWQTQQASRLAQLFCLTFQIKFLPSLVHIVKGGSGISSSSTTTTTHTHTRSLTPAHSMSLRL
jgi:hypothetical protein